MLLFLFAVISNIIAVLLLVVYPKCVDDRTPKIITVIGILAAMVAIAFYAVGIFVGIYYTSTENIYYAEQSMIRENYIDELSSNLYVNNNNIGSHELIKEVRYWNAALMSKQMGARSFWFKGMAYKSSLNIEPIDLNLYLNNN